VQSVRGGRDEFAHLYADHVWDVYGFFAYRLRSRTEAEDLTQATFERALRAWARYDPRRAGPRTWLMAIATNLLTDHYRADKSSRHTALDDGATEAAMPSTAGPEEDLGIDPSIASALTALKPREREIIALRFGGDLAAAEIAQLLGLTVANVQQISSRALRTMRAGLEGAAREAVPQRVDEP
jgi:RNA polymerase sigma-70 factor (ECF subfamily)